ncbi:hypothetical protein EYC80_007901 [Monilinia laxa]|uniref:Uncharacterized protein n=1 Tax=Monilinia laxa TaxID=61186 RepID=A0A5N6JSW0_MONLA|nr:hypothetical protein EYC80_007901 [Monilinia laxa]
MKVRNEFIYWKTKRLLGIALLASRGWLAPIHVIIPSFFPLGDSFLRTYLCVYYKDLKKSTTLIATHRIIESSLLVAQEFLMLAAISKDQIPNESSLPILSIITHLCPVQCAY